MDFVVTRTPLRVSFLGGGSDVPQYYRTAPGAVLSTAISKFVTITAQRRADDRVRLLTQTERYFTRWQDIPDPVLRSAFQAVDWQGGVDIAILSDVTPSGSGLGASSAVVVGLVNALAKISGRILSAKELADTAAHAEMVFAGREIGKQDAYPPAFGGLRHYEFLPDETVCSQRIDLNEEMQEELSSWLFIVDTGVRRDAAKVLVAQKAMTSPEKRKDVLKRMVELANLMTSDLKKENLGDIRAYFDEAWSLKAQLGALDGHPELEDIWRTAKYHGAVGAKILGAGGGGFFLLLAPKSTHSGLRNAFQGYDLQAVSIQNEGSRADLIDYKGVPSR